MDEIQFTGRLAQKEKISVWKCSKNAGGRLHGSNLKVRTPRGKRKPAVFRRIHRRETYHDGDHHFAGHRTRTLQQRNLRRAEPETSDSEKPHLQPIQTTGRKQQSAGSKQRERNGVVLEPRGLINHLVLPV